LHDDASDALTGVAESVMAMQSETQAPSINEQADYLDSLGL